MTTLGEVKREWVKWASCPNIKSTKTCCKAILLIDGFKLVLAKSNGHEHPSIAYVELDDDTKIEGEALAAFCRLQDFLCKNSPN